MRLTRRGRIVRAVAILAGIALLYWITANLWWTGTGYCFGSMTHCTL